MTHYVTSIQHKKSNSQNFKSAGKTSQKIGTILSQPTHFRKILLGIAFLALLQFPLFANNGIDLISVHPSEKTSFILHVPKSAQTSSKVVLKNMDLTVLHKEEIEAGTEKKLFNLKDLVDGEYILSVTYDNITKWEHLFLENGEIRLEEKVNTISQPTVLINDSNVDINMLCFADTPVCVSIWDDSGNQLAKEFFDSKGNIQRRYNLKDLEEGDYYIRVSLPNVPISFQFEKPIHWNPETRK